MRILKYDNLFLITILFNLFKTSLQNDKRKQRTLCIDKQEKIIEIDSHININTLSDINESEEYITCAKFYDSEGWHIFSAQTSSKFSNTVRSFAAGFIEGYIYHKLINYHFTNVYTSILKNVPLKSTTREYIYGQFNYTRDLYNEFNQRSFLSFYSYHTTDTTDTKNQIEYFETLGIILEQYRGLYSGYKAAVDKEQLISEQDFYLLTMLADLEDIIPAFEPKRLFKKEKDCSGFVKYVKETNNLIVGHNTHNLYTLMNRIYKYYNFNITLTTGKRLNDFKFSSRPADMNSKDDYYVLSNSMVVLETSLEIKNFSIYENLNVKTIPKWIRVNLANRLCNNNLDWIDTFFKHNSGTHNNQWLIIDYKEFNRFINGADTKNIIHIVEQIPILDRKYYEDFSARLINQSYVASYNAPYFKEVIENIGYTTQSDYNHARRTILFENLQGEVLNVESAKKVLRFHSKEDICDTIAPRCDLIENRPFGAVDAKITDKNMIKGMQSSIIYGPPHIEGVTEPFDFSKYEEYSHLGIPEVFDFNWIIA